MQASKHMGLPSTASDDSDDDEDPPEKRFADDILKIGLSGPEHSHLSIVDMPGLFHNPTPFQTHEDKDIIRNLIKGYVNDHRTIIM